MNADQIPPHDFPQSTEPLATPEPEPRPSLWQALRNPVREIVETLFITLIIFLLIRTVVQNFRVEGFSMEPNFHDGQYIFVNKLEYFLHAPARGDAVVLVPPTNADRDYIKRIIGLPGDRVQISNGQVSINDQPLREPYPLNRGSYNMPPTTIPQNEFFVLGDNRDNSSDSHMWGTLPRDKIVGKVWLTYWPPPLIGLVPDYSQ